MIFDSHAHYDSEQFDIDRDELLGSVLPQKGVVAVINMAADYESLKKTVALCEKYDYIYGAVGIHPECANDLPDNWLSDVEALLSHPKIVAVGEIGLDYLRPDREAQLRIFEGQLRLAEAAGKPVVLHCVKAFEETMRLLKQFRLRAVIFHGFIGSPEQARRALEKGYYLSFGVRTFSSPKTMEALRETPPGQLFLETDDSDTGIEEVYAHAAAVRGTTVEALKRATTENYERIFAPQNG